MTIRESDLPYWLVNVPPSEWPATCPEYLMNITPTARRTLSTPDANFRPHTWEEVQDIVRPSLSLTSHKHGKTLTPEPYRNKPHRPLPARPLQPAPLLPVHGKAKNSIRIHLDIHRQRAPKMGRRCGVEGRPVHVRFGRQDPV